MRILEWAHRVGVHILELAQSGCVRILEWAHGKFQNALLNGRTEWVCAYT